MGVQGEPRFIPEPVRASLGFRPELQGLRGFAVLLVVFFHAGGLLPGGFVGVDVFFVLSGYLIGGILLRELHTTGTLNLGAFFARRVRRILPAMAVVTSATLLLSVFLASLTTSLLPAVRTGIAGAAFVANAELYRAVDYFAPEAERNPLVHLWSLSVEEQFYVGFPLLMLAVALGGRRRPSNVTRLAVAVAGVVGVLSFSVAVVLLQSEGSAFGFEEPQRLAFYAPFTRAWQFIAGVLLAHSGRPASKRAVRSDVVLRCVGLAALVFASVGFSGSTGFPGFAAMVPVIGTLLLLRASEAPIEILDPVRRALSSRPLVWLGDLSYSWYLWHWPAIVFAERLFPRNVPALLAAGLLAILPAWVSFQFVESVFRKDHRIVGRRALGLAAISVLFPITVGLGVMRVAEEAEVRLRTVGELRELLDSAREFADANPLRPIDLDKSYDIILVGDSHAQALDAGFATRAKDLELEYAAIVEPGCLFLVGAYTEPQCKAWQRETLEILRRTEVATVVIHGYSTGALTGFRRGSPRDPKLFAADGNPVRDPGEALTLYGASLARLVDELASEGRTIVLLAPVPDFSSSLVDSISVWRAMRGVTIEALVRERVLLEDARERIRPVLEVKQEIAAERADVILFETATLVCLEECIQLEDDGTLIYVDLDHLAPEGASRIAEGLLVRLALVSD